MDKELTKKRLAALENLVCQLDDTVAEFGEQPEVCISIIEQYLEFWVGFDEEQGRYIDWDLITLNKKIDLGSE